MRRFFFNYQESGGGGGSSPQAKAKNAGSYGGTNRGTIASLSDMDDFIASFNVEKGTFGSLALGDTITISDGTYNASWAIAEFDYHCDVTSDFDKDYVNNFHNLALVPANGEVDLSTYQMYNIPTCTEAYKGSKINQETLPAVATSLKTVLGSHLKPFYQYVSNANISKTLSVTGYEWLLAEAFLMSEYQCFGDQPSRFSIEPVQSYEHKLPLMNVTGFGIGTYFWLRSMAPSDSYFDYFCVSRNWSPFSTNLANVLRICPLIVLA